MNETPNDWAPGYEGEIRYWGGSPFQFIGGIWQATLLPGGVEIFGNVNVMDWIKQNWLCVVISFVAGFMVKKYFFKKW